jgi:Site-specific recombinase XerD
MASYQKYQTKNGKFWLIKFTAGIDAKTGRYKHTTRRGFKTKKEAQLCAAKITQMLEQGKPISNCTLAVDLVIDEWFECYSKTGVKRSTLVNRRTSGIPHVKKHLGKCPIYKVTKKLYQDMLDSLVEYGYARGTIETANIVGKLTFKYALEQGYISDLPTTSAKIPTKRKTVDELRTEGFEDLYLERNELVKFLQVVKKSKNSIDHAIFQTLSYTGMRIGELLALQWDDIDFKEKSIRIIKTLFREKNTVKEYELTPPKTICSTRKIYADDDLMVTLFELKERQKKIQKVFPAYYDENFVFAKLDGNFVGYPELRRTLGCRLKVYLKKAKIMKNITLHGFRHTHVSLLAEAGVSLSAIQERLGHENSKTTKNIYLHMTKNVNREIVSRFTALLTSTLVTKPA